jgi:hypothetical protein
MPNEPTAGLIRDQAALAGRRSEEARSRSIAYSGAYPLI